MTRVARIVKGLGALALLAALVGAIPWALWHFVGWPLPHHVPSASQIGRALNRQGIPAQTLVDALAVVVWITWAILVVSLAVEVPAALSGRHAPHLPVAGVFQPAHRPARRRGHRRLPHPRPPPGPHRARRSECRTAGGTPAGGHARPHRRHADDPCRPGHRRRRRQPPLNRPLLLPPSPQRHRTTTSSNEATRCGASRSASLVTRCAGRRSINSTRASPNPVGSRSPTPTGSTPDGPWSFPPLPHHLLRRAGHRSEPRRQSPPHRPHRRRAPQALQRRRRRPRPPLRRRIRRRRTTPPHLRRARPRTGSASLGFGGCRLIRGRGGGHGRPRTAPPPSRLPLPAAASGSRPHASARPPDARPSDSRQPRRHRRGRRQESRGRSGVSI